MALPLPTADQMFSDPSLSAIDKAKLREEFLGKLENSAEVAVPRGGLPHQTGHGIDFAAAGQPRTPLGILQKAAQDPQITKSLSAETLQSLTAALAEMQVPDLVKDLSLTSPLATGYVAYDLEAPAKMLTPRPTPLRNSLPRRKGMGTSHRFKRITGFSGTGTGGVGAIWPGITDTTQTNFANPSSSNALYYNRGPKITYAGDESSVLYCQFSVSDELSWSTQFAGQGYQDIRALSRNAAMWASLLAEERMALYSRGTGSGYAGTLAAPTSPAGTARSATASETGISGATTNIYVRVVAESGDFGVSQASAVSSAIPVTNGQVVDVTYVLPAGATGARVFVSTGASDPGDASRWLYVATAGNVYNGRSGYNTITIQGALPTSGTVPTAYTDAAGVSHNLTSGDGGSAFATGYDGMLAYCTGSNSGYRKTLNATFSTTSPGTEFQQAFATMYLAVKAEPDRIWMAAQDRVQLSDAIKGTAASNYQLMIQQSEVGGYTMGSLVTQIQNEAIGKVTPLQVHPWLPQGNALIVSDSLPLPDSQVDSVWSFVDVQPIMGIDWPVNQFSYDTSTYWFGTFLCYAPAWNGAITGIKAV